MGDLKLLPALTLLVAIAVALIHFQHPQLDVYSVTISREALVDSPLCIQNIGAGLLAIDSADGTGFYSGPNSVFLMPKECRVIVVVNQYYVLIPCRYAPPPIRGWIPRGIRISLDGLSWMRLDTDAERSKQSRKN